MASTVENDVPI